MYANLIADIAIAVIICLCVWRGRRLGLIRTLFHTFSYLIAFLCARAFCTPLSVYFGQTKIQEAMKVKIGEMMDGIDLADGVGTVVHELSAKFSAFFEAFPIDLDGIVNDAMVAQETAKLEIAEKMAEVVSVSLSKLLAFVVIFVVALVVLRVLASLTDVIAKLPILNFCNRIGGMVIGGAKGILIGWVIVQATAKVLPILAPALGFQLNQTYLAKFFYLFLLIL